MSTKPIITTDGNQTLAVIERELKDLLDKNPEDFPKLTAAHLMGTGVVAAEDTGVRNHIDTLIPRDLRARAVGAFMFKSLLGNPVLLHELYLLQERGFIATMRETDRPDSLAHGLTDAELGRAWEIYKFNVEQLARKGAYFRKRKDWRS